MTMEDSALPKGWAHATVDDLISADGVFVDGDWVESKDQDANGSVRLIQLADIGDGQFIDKSNRHLTKSKSYELGCTFLKKGDLLIARMPDPLGRCCIFPLAGDGCFVTVVDVCIARLSDSNSSTKYLMHLLNSPLIRNEISDRQSGSTRKRISRGNLSTINLPIAPIREQRRIVAKIEELFSELDKGVEALTAAREQLKAYRQSVLKHAFDGKLTADLRSKHKAWRNVRLGDELEFLTSGSRGWADFYAKSGDTFIRAQNLKFDRLDLTDIAYVKLPEGNTEGIRTRVQIGDVLVTITGANVTKTGIVDSDLGKAYVSQHVALCRPCPSIKSRFLYWYLLSEAHGRRQLNDAAYGAGKPGLNLDNIKNVTISLPSPPEQAIVVERIETALSVENSLSESIETELQRTAALRQSILKQAFSGKLVAQAPSDEPASVLLERIRSERAKSGTTKASAKKPERKTRRARKEKEPVA